MDLKYLPTHVQSMRERVQRLYRSAGSEIQQPPALQSAFEELSVALEELRSIEEELQQQSQGMHDVVAELRQEINRQEELFLGAPVGYLITRVNGAIRRANRAAEGLLGASEKLLVGRSLAMFMPEGQRRAFRDQLEQVLRADSATPLEWSMQTWNDAPFEAAMHVRVVRSPSGKPIELYWTLYDITAQKQAAHELQQHANRLEERLHALEARQHASTVLADGTLNPPSHDSLRRQMAFLAEASSILNMLHDQEYALMHVGQLAVPAIADVFVLDLVSPENGFTRRLVVETRGRSKIPQAQWLRDVQAALPSADEADAPESPADAQVIRVPLRVRGEQVGLLRLVSRTDEKQYTPFEQALAEELANRIAHMIDRTQAYNHTLL